MSAVTEANPRLKALTGARDPSSELAALAEAGIDMRAVTDELLSEGLAQFQEATDRLIAGIEQRRARFAAAAA